MYKLVKQWKTKAGLNAYILLVEDSHHCGYVETPDCISGRDYGDYEVEVHGGLTYDGKPDWANGKHVVGFDCAHWGDKSKYYSSGVWRDVEYCTNECELLAKQLTELENN